MKRFLATLAIGLAVAVLGGWSPSPRLVEPAIALSIAWVGIENLRRPEIRGRWRITLPFGLVHGFGFAGALREISLPAAKLPVALLSFNVGVEAGQLAALAVMLPVLAWLRTRPDVGPRLVPRLSYAIVVAGTCVFVSRVMG